MASAVLKANELYPVGTTVSAYLAGPGELPPAIPLGVVVTTAVVAADSSLTFSGLLDSTRYWAYAVVNAKNVVVGFRTADVIATSAEINRLAGLGGTPLVAVERTFTETTGAGVYTGSVTVPANATIFDVVVNGISLWTATTSATMTVGDAGNASGFFAAVNLKATDLLAGESLSFDEAGGKAGAYIANSQVSPRFSSTSRVISGVVTTVGAAGAAGVTRMTVIYSIVASLDVAAAAKV